MANFINDFKCLDCKHCFKMNPLFSLLNEEELDSLNNSRSEVSFKKGEIIYKQGTPLTHIVIIHTGLGKIYIEGPKEKNLILTYTKKYDLNGGVGVFIDFRHHSSLMAVIDSGACFIEINTFKEIIRKNNAFMEAYLREFSQRILHTYYQFSALTQKNMEGRMAESILYLKDQIFNNGSIKNISKQDLAELTAMTKESALRVLKEFKDDGLLEVNGSEIRIIDQKAMQKIANYG